MEVIILAGGIGSRLQPVVNDVPKCMAEVAGKPFLFYLFRQLIPFNPTQVILSLGYKHEVVENWLRIQDFPFPICCKIEPQPLGTGGGIKYAFTAVQDTSAIIINGDTYFDIDFAGLYSLFNEQRVEVAIALKKMIKFDRYGSVIFHPKNFQISSFKEKKYCEEGYINGGIYVLQKESLKNFPDKFSLEKDYFPLKAKEKNIIGFPSDGLFIDIGIPSDYFRAQTIFTENE